MKILIISFSDIQNDPRVYRQVVAYAKDHDVTTLGRGAFSYRYVRHIEAPQKPAQPLAMLWRVFLLLSRQYVEYMSYTYGYKSSISCLENYDVVFANDVEALPLAAQIKGKARLIFDAHEYSPRQFENRLIWKLLVKPLNTYIISRYIDMVDQFLTVSEGIAQEYHRVFGKKPMVMTNASEYHGFNRDSHISYNKSEDKVRLIHHGTANPGRKLDTLIDMMDYLDARYELTLMLVANNNRYLGKLKKLAEGKNVVFRNPVPMKDIVPVITEYDIGLAVFLPTTFNLKHVLPNKLFEFIQARLAVVIGPSEEMANIVNQYQIGVVANNFSALSIAEAIKSVDKNKLTNYRNNCDVAAKEVNAEANIAVLKSLL